MWSVILTAGVLALTMGAIAYFVERKNGPSGQQKSADIRLLPGDISYESPSGNFRFYFPLTTSIVLSVVLSLVLRFFG